MLTLGECGQAPFLVREVGTSSPWPADAVWQVCSEVSRQHDRLMCVQVGRIDGNHLELLGGGGEVRSLPQGTPVVPLVIMGRRAL